MTTPLYQQTFARIAPAQSISFGDQSVLPNLLLDGSHSFSVCFTFRTSQATASEVLFIKGNQFTFGLTNGVPFAQLANSAVLNADSSFVLLPDQFYALMCTYACTGPNAGTLTLSLEGTQIASADLTNAGMANDSGLFQFGGEASADLVGLCLWNVAVPLSECLASQWMMPDPGSPGLVSCYCFADGPPMDDSGNGHPITFVGGAGQITVVPGFLVQNGGYVVPAASDGLNPGGAGNQPFSLLSWVYCTGAISGSLFYDIFSNCTLTSGIQMSLCKELTGASAALGMTWNGQIGSNSVFATQLLGFNAWHHVAVTYDGTTFTLYVDGQPSGSAASGTMNVVATPAPVIGAMYPSGTAQNRFEGYISALQVWSTALSAAEVSTYMTTDPGTAPGCVANFRGFDASNGITGIPASLINGATVSFQSSAGGAGLARSTIRGAARNPAPRWPDLRAVLAEAPAQIQTRPKSKFLSDAMIDQLIAGYEAILSRTKGLSPAQTEALRKLFLNNLYRGLRHYDAYDGRPPGSVSHRRDGDDHVFEVATENGPVEACRVSDAALAQAGKECGISTECITWYVTLLADGIMIIVQAIGLGVVGASVVAKFFATWVPKVLQTLIPAMKIALAEANQFDKLIETIDAIYECGGLASALAETISGLHWWNWVFIVLDAVVSIVALWVSGGWYLALIIANLASSIAQFITAVEHQPEGGCTTCSAAA